VASVLVPVAWRETSVNFLGQCLRESEREARESEQRRVCVV
jgi:hypothetical protein